MPSDSPRPGVPATPVGAPPVLDPIDPVDPLTPLTPVTVIRDDDASSPTTAPDSTTERGRQAAGAAADAGRQVAGSAQDQASRVAGEAAQQAHDLLRRTRDELQEQAATQQRKVAGGIRALSDDLTSMADGSDRSGSATDAVREASRRSGEVADWLERREPGGLLDDVRSFARRRPVTFLAIAAGAGLVAGRLTRGAVDDARDSGSAAGSFVVGEPDHASVEPPVLP